MIIIYCLIAIAIVSLIAIVCDIIDMNNTKKELQKEFYFSTYFHLWDTLIEDEKNITYICKNSTSYYFDYANRYTIILFQHGKCALFNKDASEFVLSSWHIKDSDKLLNMLQTKIIESQK